MIDIVVFVLTMAGLVAAAGSIVTMYMALRSGQDQMVTYTLALVLVSAAAGHIKSGLLGHQLRGALADRNTAIAELEDLQDQYAVLNAELDQIYDDNDALWDDAVEMSKDFRQMCDEELDKAWSLNSACWDEMGLIWEMRCRDDYAGIQAMLTCEGGEP